MYSAYERLAAAVQREGEFVAGGAASDSDNDASDSGGSSDAESACSDVHDIFTTAEPASAAEAAVQATAATAVSVAGTAVGTVAALADAVRHHVGDGVPVDFVDVGRRLAGAAVLQRVLEPLQAQLGRDHDCTTAQLAEAKAAAHALGLDDARRELLAKIVFAGVTYETRHRRFLVPLR